MCDQSLTLSENTRTVDVWYVEISKHNFVVSEPKSAIFFAFNAVHRLSIPFFVLEIFAVKVESCPKSRRILIVFCFRKF